MRSESAVRAAMRRAGFRMSKSRRRESGDNLGEFMVADEGKNCVVLGGRYDATLAACDEWLRAEEAEV